MVDLMALLEIKGDLERELENVRAAIKGGPAPRHWPNQYGPEMRPEWKLDDCTTEGGFCPTSDRDGAS